MIKAHQRSDSLSRGTRGYMEIVYSILAVCLNGSIKTHVMFRCNLNSKQLQSYLDSLLGRSLLEETTGHSSAKLEYFTTAKGRKYIGIYDALIEILEGQGNPSGEDHHLTQERYGRPPAVDGDEG